MSESFTFRRDPSSNSDRELGQNCPVSGKHSVSAAPNFSDPVLFTLQTIAAIENPNKLGAGLPPRMLSRFEEQWQKLLTTLDSTWEWEKVTAIWQTLIELDFRFFRGRFRSVASEIIPSARYIPASALSLILQYCRHQPPEIKRLYYNIWEYQLRTQRWMHPRQSEIVDWHLQRWYLSPPAFPQPGSQS